MRKNFLKNNKENEVTKLVPDLFLFFRKTLYDVKENGLHLSFNIFKQFVSWTNHKSKLYKYSDC